MQCKRDTRPSWTSTNVRSFDQIALQTLPGHSVAALSHTDRRRHLAPTQYTWHPHWLSAGMALLGWSRIEQNDPR